MKFAQKWLGKIADLGLSEEDSPALRRRVRIVNSGGLLVTLFCALALTLVHLTGGTTLLNNLFMAITGAFMLALLALNYLRLFVFSRSLLLLFENLYVMLATSGMGEQGFHNLYLLAGLTPLILFDYRGKERYFFWGFVLLPPAIMLSVDFFNINIENAFSQLFNESPLFQRHVYRVALTYALLISVLYEILKGFKEDEFVLKRKYETSQETGRVLETILNHDDRSVWMIDREYRLVAMNKHLEERLRRNFGLRVQPGASIVEPSESIHSPDEARTIFIRWYDQALAGEKHAKVFRYELNGQEVAEEMRFSPVIEGGEIKGAIIFARDITELEKAAQSLRDSRQQFETLFEESNDAVFIADKTDQRIELCNKRAVELFEAESKDQFDGLLGTDLHLEPPDKKTREEYLRQFERRGALDAVVSYRTFQGRIFEGRLNLKHIILNGERKNLVTVRDVTERVRSRNALEESRLKFESVFNNVKDAIFITENHKIADCNRAAVELFAANAKEELLGKTGDDLTGRSFSEAEVAAIVEQIQAKGYWEGEFEYRCMNGSRFWGHVVSTPLQSQPVERRLVRITDIDAQKRANDELARMERMFRKVIEMSGDAIYVKDLDNRLVLFNPQYASYFGVPEEQLQGADIFSLDLPDETLQIYREKTRKVAQEGLPHTFDVRVRTPAMGTPGYFRSTLAPLFDADQNLAGIIGITRNITDLKTREHILRDSLELLQATQELLDGASWECDFAAGRNIWTPQMYKLYELDAAEPDYDAILKLLSPEEAAAYEEALRRAKEELAPFNVTFEIETATGRRKYVQSIGRPVKSAEGICAKIIGIDVDITGIKTAEQRLNDARKAAEAADKAKSDFLAHMSHDLRNPLHGILGGVKLLEQHAPLDEAQQESLKLIRASHARLANSLGNVLEFARIGSGDNALNLAPFNLKRLVEEASALAEFLAGQRGLDFVCNWAPEESVWLLGDGEKLARILDNLISNAVKFTDQGEVRLEIESWEKDGNCAFEFVVADTGPGVSAEQQKEIFEPFRQADASSTKLRQGAGLGLSISERLAAMLDGELTLDSAPGKGARFALRVGFPKSGPPADAPAPPDFGPLEGLRVLVCEDDEVNARYMRNLLKRAGMKARVVYNGKQATSIYSKQKFDFVLMDGAMPVVDGFEATRQIREIQREAGRYAPILAVTGYALPEDRKRFLDAGADDVLVKPLDADDLFRAMLEQLQPV